MEVVGRVIYDFLQSWGSLSINSSDVIIMPINSSCSLVLKTISVYQTLLDLQYVDGTAVHNTQVTFHEYEEG